MATVKTDEQGTHSPPDAGRGITIQPLHPVFAGEVSGVDLT